LQDVPDNHKHNILNESERELSEIDKKINLLIQEKPSAMKKIEEERLNLKVLESKKEEMESHKSRLEYLEESQKKSRYSIKAKRI